MPKQTILIPTENPNIFLRELRNDADIHAMLTAVTENPEYSDSFGNTITENLGTFQQIKDQWLNNPNCIRLAVWLNDEFIGFVRAVPSEDNPKRAEIGYFIRKNYSGNGYAALALKALTPYALTKYSELYGEIHRDHIASQQVIEKCGYIHTSSEEMDWGPAKIYTYRPKAYQPTH